MIFVTGDTHGSRSLERFKGGKWPMGEAPGAGDSVVVLGDFGFFCSPPLEEDDQQKLAWLGEQPWMTLFIDGNHDNIPRLKGLPRERRFGGPVGVVVPGKVFHLRRGQVYTLEGRSVFSFGGGLSIDRDLRTEGKDWWPDEIPSSEEMAEAVENLESLNWKVDLVFTHVGPKSVVEGFFRFPEKIPDPAELFFDGIRERLEFGHWYFGHYHEDTIGRSPRFTALYRSVLRA